MLLMSYRYPINQLNQSRIRSAANRKMGVFHCDWQRLETKTQTHLLLMKTSLNTPLQIDELSAGPGGGVIGISQCPGKKNLEWLWDRDLEKDLQVIVDWNASVVVTLVETHELIFLRVPNLGNRVKALGMEWLHLPIRDGGIPDTRFKSEWETKGEELHRQLDEGARILIHCRGGKGRSGLLAATILVERGCNVSLAVEEVRAARSGAIEKGPQEAYIFGGIVTK